MENPTPEAQIVKTKPKRQTRKPKPKKTDVSNTNDLYQETVERLIQEVSNLIRRKLTPGTEI